MVGRTIEIAHAAYDERVEESVISVLRSGRISQGPVVEALEQSVAALTGVRYAVAVSNGTASLIAALHVLGVGAGDEVITSPFTFVATLNAILAVGARARFADIGPSDFNVRSDCIESLISSRTKALMPVHLFGQSADMTAISRIAQRHGLALIEDAAQAMGATHAGRAVGSFGLGSFSMYATKNVSTGEGGVVTTDDELLANAVRRIRNHGAGEQHRYESFGMNLRLTDLQAAVGLPQLESLDRTNQLRAQHAATLSDHLGDVPGLVVPLVREGDRHVFHQYTLRIDSNGRLNRDELRSLLATSGVNTAVYYSRLVFDHPCFSEHPLVGNDHCPVAETVARQVLSLPVHQHLSEADLRTVGGLVKAAMS